MKKTRLILSEKHNFQKIEAHLEKKKRAVCTNSQKEGILVD